MKTLLIILMLPVVVLAQHRFLPEQIFGLDISVRHWGDEADEQFMGAPNTGLLGVPSDAACLMFEAGADTFEVVLIVDRMTRQIRRLRSITHEGTRHLQHISSFVAIGPDSTSFLGPSAIAVASTGYFYNESSDRIFISDRMNHRLARLNFHFNPTTPEADYFTWESSSYIDSLFFPADLEYVILNPNNMGANKVVAIDDHSERLAVFSNSGDLQNISDLHQSGDSTMHIYSSLAYKLNPPNSVWFYLADRASCSIRRFAYTVQNGIQFQNQITLSDSSECELANIIFHTGIGLWALESNGPHVYHLANDLSAIIREISPEEIDTRLAFRPKKIILLPGRLLVFEQIGSSTGIMSFSANQSFGKLVSENEGNVPLVFSLSQNYPNPFNPSTSLWFSLPEPGWAKVEIFNILGQKIVTLANEYRVPGRYNTVWNGLNSTGEEVSSGLYFARLSWGDKRQTVKMTLLK